MASWEAFSAWSAEGLDAWFETWVTGIASFVMYAGLVVVALILLAGALTPAPTLRRFWCRLAGRDVEVEFETRGLWRRATAVIRCSAFETAAPIACQRQCLEATYRRQWEPPLPCGRAWHAAMRKRVR
jgi:hypothetical protein